MKLIGKLGNLAGFIGAGILLLNLTAWWDSTLDPNGVAIMVGFSLVVASAIAAGLTHIADTDEQYNREFAQAWDEADHIQIHKDMGDFDGIEPEWLLHPDDDK